MVFSKIYKLNFKDPYQPCTVLHPWISGCTLNFFDIFYNSFCGSCKFFFLVNVLPSLIKEGFHQENIKNEVLGLARSCLVGAFAGSVSMSTLCMLRHILGRFYLFSIGFIPGSLGGGGIFFENSTRRKIYVTLFIALVSDLYLKILCDKDLLVMNRSKEWFLFASGSSLLLYCLRKYRKSNSVLWPFIPYKLADDSRERKNCPHKGKCVDHIKQSMKKYFGVALVLQFAKTMIFNFAKIITRPSTFFKVFFHIKNLRMPFFAGLYIGIFKAASCLLLRLRGQDEAWQALLAGGLASFAFLLHPNTSLAFIACSNLLQIVLREHVRDKLPDWPWESLVFMVLLGLLFHARAANPESFPSYMYYIMDTVTSNRAKDIYDLVEARVISR